jgi:hypothetical protein
VNCHWLPLRLPHMGYRQELATPNPTAVQGRKNRF